MFLVSPSGARSRIVFAAQTTLFNSDGTTEKLLHPLTESFRFGSARHLGENATGTWTLRIADAYENDVGTLKSWSLKIYGHGSTAGVPLVTTTPVNQALAVEWTAPDDTGDPDCGDHLVRRALHRHQCHRQVRCPLENGAERLGPGPRRPALRHPQPRERHGVRRAGARGQQPGQWTLVRDRER